MRCAGSGGRTPGCRRLLGASGQPGAACAPLGKQMPALEAPVQHRLGERRSSIVGGRSTEGVRGREEERGQGEKEASRQGERVSVSDRADLRFLRGWGREKDRARV